MKAQDINTLTVNEALLKIFITHAPFAIAMLDCDMRYIACSECWLTNYSLQDQDILGRSHSKTADKTDQGLQWDALPWHSSEGKPGGIIIFLKNVAERKKLEESLLMSNLIFQTSMEGILITDENNLIVDLNPSFTKISGYTLSEVNGKNPRILQSGRHSMTFYQEMWQSLMEKGRWQGEIWGKRKDGTLQISIANISVIHHENGTVYRYVAQYLDITEQLLPG